MKRTTSGVLAVVALGALAGCSGSLGKEGAHDGDASGGTSSGQGSGAGQGMTVGGGGTSGGGANGGAGAAMKPDPNALSQDALFVCDGKPASSPGRVRRIGRTEWTRDVNGNFGRGPSSSSVNPFDPKVGDPYSTYASDVTVDSTVLDLYLNIVDTAADGWVQEWDNATNLEVVHDDPSLQCIFNDDHPAADCVKHYVTTLLTQGVYHRPPIDDEVAHLQTYAGQVLAAEADPKDRSQTLTLVVEAAWLSTGAIFRTELGQGPPDASGRQKMTSWEIANELAYAIDDHGPGAPRGLDWEGASPTNTGYFADIVAAAKSGAIEDGKTRGALLKPNFGGTDPKRNDLYGDDDERYYAARGQYWLSSKLAGFFREWLGYGHVDTVFKDSPGATSQFVDPKTGEDSEATDPSYDNLLTGYYAYESTLVQQFDDMIAKVVVGDKDVLKNLLTTREFFVAATVDIGGGQTDDVVGVARPYGIAGSVPATAEGRWQMLAPNERAGVLTHPAWLAAHGNNFEDDPSLVHRGKWVREKLLCSPVPPLSEVKVVAKVGPSAPDQSARQRLDKATASATCQACHGLMNPLGYPFEIYNHAGYLRATDHQQTPDGHTTLTAMPDPTLDGDYKDAVELSEKFAGSPYVERCFLRQAFRYFMGRDETAADACALAAMETAYDQNQGSFEAALEALFASDTFVYRSAATAAGGGQ